MRKLLATLLALSSIALVQANEPVNDELVERIKPVGKVYLAGAEPEEKEDTGPKSGDQVYTSACSACHGAGVMGAPKYGNAGDWGPRAAQGLDVLYGHALNGFNAMPEKGGCMTCSDDEIKAAVKYMVEGSK